MFKKSCMVLLVGVLLLQGKLCFCVSSQGKLFTGIALALSGMLLANEGYQQVERTEMVELNFEVDYTWEQQVPFTYTWTEEVVDQEWDFIYKVERESYNAETMELLDTEVFSYTDLYPSSIAYEWGFKDYYSYSAMESYQDIFYINHHKTYETIYHSDTKYINETKHGTKTVTEEVEITTKEYKNINQGIAGICLMSIGLNQVISYLQENPGEELSKSKARPEIKFLARKGRLDFLASMRF